MSGSIVVNLSGLLHCGKTSLPGWRTWLGRETAERLMLPRVRTQKNIGTTSRGIRLLGLKWLSGFGLTKCELFLAFRVHDTLRHQGGDPAGVIQQEEIQQG